MNLTHKSNLCCDIAAFLSTSTEEIIGTLIGPLSPIIFKTESLTRLRGVSFQHNKWKLENCRPFLRSRVSPRFYWGFLAWSYNSQVAQRLSFHDGVPQFPCKRPEWGNRECCETRRWRIIPLVNHKMTKYYNIVESIQNVCIYHINQSESKRLTNQLACFYLSSLCFDSAKQKKTLRSVFRSENPHQAQSGTLDPRPSCMFLLVKWKGLKLWKLPSCQLMHFRRWCFFSPGGICQFTGGYHDFCSFPCCFHCLLPKLVQLFMLQVTNSELLVTPKSKGWYPKSRWTYHLRPQEFLSPFFGGLTLKQTEGDLQNRPCNFSRQKWQNWKP